MGAPKGKTLEKPATTGSFSSCFTALLETGMRPPAWLKATRFRPVTRVLAKFTAWVLFLE